jgi:hypothetical protein
MISSIYLFYSYDASTVLVMYCEIKKPTMTDGQTKREEDAAVSNPSIPRHN